MIAEQAKHSPEETKTTHQPLSLPRVVGALQVMLATRRAARNAEHAFWYSVTRNV